MRALLKVGFALLVLAFALIAVSYSMLRAQGANGPSSPGSRLVATDKRPLDADVERIELSGPVNLTLRQGPAPLLEVRGEQRLLPNIDTRVEGNTLHVGPRGILLRHRTPIEVQVTLPMLETLSVTGSGNHTVSGFAGDHLDITLDGSGNIRFNGRYRNITAAVHGSGDLELTGGNSDHVEAEVQGSGTLTLVGASRELHAVLEGSGDVDARHLHADDVNLAHEGSGTSSVYARKNANVKLTGSGDTTIYGNPDNRAVSREGSGKVSFRDSAGE
jgi:hypothetical protein